MKLKTLVVTLAMLAAAPAAADWFGVAKGNDTGGIISWSPNLHETLQATASAHCAFYNKVALITGLPAQPGDYAAFVCAFPRDYDPEKTRWNWFR